MSLKGRNIVLGVSGSIAAYKAAFLVRLLKKAGAEVQVILTKGGSDFVSPLTFSTLSEREVVLTYSSPEGNWFNHVEMGLWAELILVAPATSHTLSQLVHGEADEALLGTILSARCPVWVAPAMDLDMFTHPATQGNLATLAQRGVRVLEPAAGELASGLVGKGRLQEPEKIVRQIESFFAKANRFQDKKVLITAGPTQEAIDPVRYLSNHSSGKMGLAIAEAFLQQGAEVHMVLGPVQEPVPEQPNLHVYKVTSAVEMNEQAQALSAGMDFFVLAAAVADYRPAEAATEKIKKGPEDEMVLRLVKNPDIAAGLGASKRTGQKLVGFALETEDALANARKKLDTKKLDMVVLNNMKEKGAGFAYDTNRVSFVKRQGTPKSTKLLPKKEIAELILDEIYLLHD